MSLPEGLLETLKNYLDYTWGDAGSDEKLAGILSRGIAYIDRIAGEKLDYTKEEKPQELLFDYCRYVRDNALNEFKANYLHELIALQVDKGVERYGKPDV
ncbi:hypothetical protein LJC61_02755 [Ruminococcaceae bacterium OttesenSCG-928-A16]|nr:hypothetical protein [Ruminococcaceae bacterium OttesenSCG-928-A16]